MLIDDLLHGSNFSPFPAVQPLMDHMVESSGVYTGEPGRYSGELNTGVQVGVCQEVLRSPR